MVLVFHRVGDRVQLIRRNIHYKAPAGTPIEKAVKQNYTDSVLLALPILSINRSGGNAILIDLSDIFMTDFAQLGLGFYRQGPRRAGARSRRSPTTSRWSLRPPSAAAATDGSDDDGVADSRGVTARHPLQPDEDCPTPAIAPAWPMTASATSSAPRRTSGSDESPLHVRPHINRWRLEKADPRAKLSAPKKQIVWYVEDNVPFEYRPYVEEGILEWNKAFEKIGFRDAIAVRWQQPGEDFDPEDTELLHLPLDHHQPHLRHVLPAGQPDDRRDDRRRRHLRRVLDSRTGKINTPS